MVQQFQPLNDEPHCWPAITCLQQCNRNLID